MTPTRRWFGFTIASAITIGGLYLLTVYLNDNLGFSIRLMRSRQL